jgi:hypothetical protein
VPPEEFPGGLQNRFGVVGVNPFSLEEGGAVKLTVDVANLFRRVETMEPRSAPSPRTRPTSPIAGKAC